MTATSPRKAAASTILIIVGIGLAALAVLAHGSERLSYGGSAPAAYVHITAGQRYTLAVPGGITALNDKGVEQASIPCTATFANGSPAESLAVTAESADSRATNVFGRFTATSTGTTHIECLGWGAVYVDDADDAPRDLAFIYLVLCALALAIGTALLMSVLRGPGRPPQPSPATLITDEVRPPIRST